jgi:hypothetical protein
VLAGPAVAQVARPRPRQVPAHVVDLRQGELPPARRALLGLQPLVRQDQLAQVGVGDADEARRLAGGKAPQFAPRRRRAEALAHLADLARQRVGMGRDHGIERRGGG